jgi:hypothetical protein
MLSLRIMVLLESCYGIWVTVILILIVGVSMTKR